MKVSAPRPEDSPHPQIRYLDGFRLQRAVLAGIRRLTERREQLNSINVYPVPDADTGTNMAKTMATAADSLRRSFHRSAEHTGRILAESAILGSHGNSGAILAQFLTGFSEGVTGKTRIGTVEFAAAVERARQAAYAAIARPREGTILTVIKDWAEEIARRCGETSDFAELLKAALHRARESLKRTPDQLEVLKKHGVVDAGAQGFVHFLEGITDFVETGDLRAPEGKREEAGEEAPAEAFVYAHEKVSLQFRYCTECLVRTQEPVPPERVRELLEPLGDSLVVVSGAALLKVHLHTNEPLRMYEILREMGTLATKKCDDMQLQHDSAVEDRARVAIVSDSSCDLPMDYVRNNFISLVPLKVLFGEETFLDKVEISPEEFLRKCRRTAHHPKTSQPSVQDFLRVYEEAAGRKREIVVLTLSAALSGTYQAAVTAASKFTQADVHVLDSRTVSVGLGLLVQEARRMALSGESASAISARMEELRSRVRVFVSLRTLDFLRRGGRISFGRSLAAKLLGLHPVVEVDGEGKVVSPAKAFGMGGVRRKVLRLARAEWEKYGRFRLAVAHVDGRREAAFYLKRLRRLTGLTDIPVVEATPVLGAHVGPGAAGIAVLGLEPK